MRGGGRGGGWEGGEEGEGRKGRGGEGREGEGRGGGEGEGEEGEERGRGRGRGRTCYTLDYWFTSRLAISKYSQCSIQRRGPISHMHTHIDVSHLFTKCSPP